ncbi:hypothetical protein GCM10027031_04400 [Corynebacterium atrinae]
MWRRTIARCPSSNTQDGHVWGRGYDQAVKLENVTANRDVTAEDVEWIRLQRRSAATEPEYIAVRARLFQLAADLEQRPAPSSPWILALFGVLIIGAGCALGYGIYLIADSMWAWLNS